MKGYFTFLFVLLLFSASIFAQNAHKLKGTLKTQNDEIIAGANLYFEKDGQTNVAATDINGEFKIELAAGDYEITVSKELSENFVAFLKIQEKGLNPGSVDLTVQTDFESPYPKPIKLPYAAYPSAAMATRATGEVVVSVNIAKDGNVISAKAENGHPLLRSAAEKAATNSMFEPAENAAPRQAKLTYVFLNSYKQSKDLKRFTNPFRIEIFWYPTPIDY